MLIRRSLIAAAAALAVAAAPLSAFASESEPEAAGWASSIADMEENEEEMVSEKDAFSEIVYLAFEDGFRSILEQLFGVEDLSWLETMQLDMSGSNGEVLDLNAIFSLNDTELYHAYLTVDMAAQKAYLQIPELKEQPLSVDISDVMQQAQSAASMDSGLSDEVVNKIADQAMEFFSSIPQEKLEEEVMTYLNIFASRLKQETGSTTVTAGDLSVEATTMSYTFDDTAVAEIIPELLTTVSTDELIKSFFESEFGQSLITEAAKTQGMDVTAAELYDQLASTLGELAVTGDFSSIPGGTLTLAVDENGTPVQIGLDLVMQDVSMELFKASFLSDGSKNGFNLEIGSMAASMIGAEGNGETAVKASGEISDDGLLNETVSVVFDGTEIVSADVVDLDLVSLTSGAGITGTVNLNAMDTKITYELSVTEDGYQANVIKVNDEVYVTELVAVFTGDDVYTETVDPTDAFEMTDDESSINEYMEDADIKGALELLKTAGVPEDLVDSLINGPSAEGETESDLAA